MYEQFYGFKERPFSLLPDPDFLYLGDKHQAALDLLELTIFNQAGFCVVSGEIGAGKTTLIRELLNRLDDDICVGLISNTHPSFGELLQWIMSAFSLSCDTGDQFELHKRFLDFVIQRYSENKRTLLIIDEAQNLSVSAMEELRMLSNVNSDKDLVLQIILVGQNQLRDKLQLPELQQFAQRIAVDHHLTGLDETETCDYIQYRVTRAGGSRDLFSADACRTIYRCSDGIPRLINGICDICLVYGYSDKSPVITPELVREVVNDQRTGHIRTPGPGGKADDVELTAFGSTLAAAAGSIENKSTVRLKPESEPPRAEIPAAGQMPDPQEKIATLEASASEDTEHPAKATTQQASSGAAPETIVGAMEALRQQGLESKAAGEAQHTVSENHAADLSRPHRPVSGAEQRSGLDSRERSPVVFRAIIGLVLLMSIGVAGWLSWLAWDESPVAGTVAADAEQSAVPAAKVNVPAIDPLRRDNTSNTVEQREAARLEEERPAAEKQLAEQREVERLERERQEAEKRLAELREAERVERERLATEKQLAEQREAARLEEERLAAEKRLAEQREAARLEQERLQAEKRLAEQREAARLERERQQAEKRLAELREAERLERQRLAAERQRATKQREALRLERQRQEEQKRLAEQQRAAELEAKRAAALEAWEKANSGIGWAEDPEDAKKLLEEQRAAELEAKRAAALEAWKKANSGIDWAEESEDESD
ncbi:MAG: AAA family ATPase [Thiogranum sp.]